MHDSIAGVVERRVAELGRSGFLANDSTILTSYLGLERLLRTQFGYELDFAAHGLFGLNAGVVAANIASVLR